MNDRIQLHIHHVAIQTANFDKAFKFYSDVLGLSIVKEPFSYKSRTLTWLEAGTLKIELYSMKNGEESVEYNRHRVGTNHIAIEVNDLDYFMGYLSEKGIGILRQPYRPPTNDPFQPRIALIEGTDGEEIEIRECPHYGSINGWSAPNSG